MFKRKNKKKKEKKSPLSVRAGSKIGNTISNGLRKAYSYKAVRIGTIVAVLAVFFILIVPIKNNILTVLLLLGCAVLYIIVTRKKVKK